MAVESRDTAGLVRRLVQSGRGDAALRLASEAFRAGQQRTAEVIAQAALDAGHIVPQVYYILAAAARATGRPALAADMARVGIALDSDPVAARSDLAGVLLELGKPAEAAETLEAIPGPRRDRKCQERLGNAYGLAGRRSLARMVFKSLLASNPADDRARRALAGLAPRPANEVLDGIGSRLSGSAALLFARLRQGPATEVDLQAALAAAGHRRTLIKALVQDLAERTRQGALPLVSVIGDQVSLDLSVLDVKAEAEGANQ